MKVPKDRFSFLLLSMSKEARVESYKIHHHNHHHHVFDRSYPTVAAAVACLVAPVVLFACSLCLCSLALGCPGCAVRAA